MTAKVGGRLGILAHMGFDPSRKYRRSPFDFVFVGVGVALCIALVAWALLA